MEVGWRARWIGLADELGREKLKLLPPGVTHTLRLKCAKFDFGWGSAPHPSGELTVLHQSP